MDLDEDGISEFQIQHEFQEVSSFEPIAHKIISYRITWWDLSETKTAPKQCTCGLPWRWRRHSWDEPNNWRINMIVWRVTYPKLENRIWTCTCGLPWRWRRHRWTKQLEDQPKKENRSSGCRELGISYVKKGKYFRHRVYSSSEMVQKAYKD